MRRAVPEEDFAVARAMIILKMLWNSLYCRSRFIYVQRCVCPSAVSNFLVVSVPEEDFAEEGLHGIC